MKQNNTDIDSCLQPPASKSIKIVPTLAPTYTNNPIKQDKQMKIAGTKRLLIKRRPVSSSTNSLVNPNTIIEDARKKPIDTETISQIIEKEDTQNSNSSDAIDCLVTDNEPVVPIDSDSTRTRPRSTKTTSELLETDSTVKRVSMNNAHNSSQELVKTTTETTSLSKPVPVISRGPVDPLLERRDSYNDSLVHDESLLAEMASLEDELGQTKDGELFEDSSLLDSRNDDDLMLEMEEFI